MKATCPTIAVLAINCLVVSAIWGSAPGAGNIPVIQYIQEAPPIPCPPDCSFYGHHGYKPGDPLCTPGYSIEIFDNGLVVYEGRKNVATRGQQKGWIPPDVVVRLKNSFERAGFLDFKAVVIDPKTGMTTHDCKQNPAMLAKYGLAELCNGRDKVERFERMRLEKNWPETVLFFRSGNRSNQLRGRDVSLGGDVHRVLGQEVNEAVDSSRWVHPITCDVQSSTPLRESPRKGVYFDYGDHREKVRPLDK